MTTSAQIQDRVSIKARWYVVLRPFTSGGIQRVQGEVLDSSTWPYGRAELLTEDRRIAPLPTDVALPEPVEYEGRKARLLGRSPRPAEPPPDIEMGPDGKPRKVSSRKR